MRVLRRIATGGLVCAVAAGVIWATIANGDGDESAPSRAAGSSCPTTSPNGRTPPGERQSDNHHGNGRLWTVLPPQGYMSVSPVPVAENRHGVNPDGTIRTKMPWWGSRAAGRRLRITGRRLDGEGTLRARISPGKTGAPHFWATRMIFAGEGCWRVKARSGRARLRFVIEIAKTG